MCEYVFRIFTHFSFIDFPCYHGESCHFYSFEGGLDRPSFDILQHTIRAVSLIRMCSQGDGNGKFWKENASKIFLSLRCIHSCEKGHRLTHVECSFYFECKLRAKDGHSGLSGVVA